MITATAAVGFFVALLPVVLTPGASFTLVTGKALSGDRRGALGVLASTMCGILTHAILAGFGLAALVMASSQAYTVVRLVGAIVMIGLGVQLLWHAGRGRATSEAAIVAHHDPLSRTVLGAYGANVLNVKAAAVYLTVAPQFLSADQAGVPAMVALAGVHIAMQSVWLGVLILGWGALARRVNPVQWRRRLDAAGGVVLVALGTRTVATAR